MPAAGASDDRETDHDGRAKRGGDRAPSRAALAALFDAALAHHRRNELAEAEGLYRRVLAAAPGEVAALHHLALVCASSGRLEQGIRLIRRALRRAPDSAVAHNDLGAMLKLAGRLDDAAASFGAALALDPGFAKAHYNLGATLRALARTEPALEHLARALALDPGFAVAHADLGVALADLGRFDDALPHCRQALALDPGNLKARLNLGKLLQALGRPEEALACFEAALAHDSVPVTVQARIGLLLLQLKRFEPACTAFRQILASRPEFAEAHCNLGIALLALNRHDEAVDCLKRSIALRPDRPEAHIALGNALQELGDCTAALACYRAALAIDPDDVDAHNNLAAALAALGRHDNALAIARAALGRAPHSVEAHHNVGIALAGLGREDDALAWFDKTLALQPDHAAALANRASALKVVGRLDDARAALRRAIALDPRVPRFYRALIDCGTLDAPLRAGLEALSREPAALSPVERIHLHFALAQLHDDADEPASAFTHLAAGNALQRRLIDYDEAAVLAGFARLRATFVSTPAPAVPPAAPRRPTPIFIVGMPRAGTTLVEQILAGHPAVFGAGELECFPEALAARGAPELPDARDAEAWQALGEAYRGAIARLAPPDAQCLTDKLPLNAFHVGPIHRALPDARIVHVRRDPLDTCLSCFFKVFAGNQPFAYDLGELGRYYRAYDAAMAHWRAVLPAGAMLEVRYEDVVADLEREARRLVAHCGLAWDDACLAFHRTARPVRTASVAQVRRPLYRDALGRAARYRPWLGPLIAALAGAPADPPPQHPG